MQWSKWKQLFDFGLDFLGDFHGVGETFTSMYHTVSHSVNFIRVFDHSQRAF